MDGLEEFEDDIQDKSKADRDERIALEDQSEAQVFFKTFFLFPLLFLLS